jgi:aryl-alcohol dehydrogenase-like predicted oxidoreductase
MTQRPAAQKLSATALLPGTAPVAARIGIGGAQLGMPYGISNDIGVPSPSQLQDMLQLAAEQGVRVIDTAPLYGASEQALGSALPPAHHFDIITKTPQFGSSRLQQTDAAILTDTFCRSLEKLRQPSLYGLLVHDGQDLLRQRSETIYEALCRLKGQGLVRKIGVSVYTPDEVQRIRSRFAVDLVQMPLNVFDQRALASGCIPALQAAGIEVHTRSAFLQGLLLMTPEKLQESMAPARRLVRAWREHLAAHDMGALEAALGFVLQRPDVQCCIVGTCSAAQLAEVLQAARYSPAGPMDFAPFACEDENIVNPSHWGRA